MSALLYTSVSGKNVVMYLYYYINSCDKYHIIQN